MLDSAIFGKAKSGAVADTLFGTIKTPLPQTLLLTLWIYTVPVGLQVAAVHYVIDYSDQYTYKLLYNML